MRKILAACGCVASMMIIKSSASSRTGICSEASMILEARGEMIMANTKRDKGHPCVTTKVGQIRVYRCTTSRIIKHIGTLREWSLHKQDTMSHSITAQTAGFGLAADHKPAEVTKSIQAAPKYQQETNNVRIAGNKQRQHAAFGGRLQRV